MQNFDESTVRRGATTAASNAGSFASHNRSEPGIELGRDWGTSNVAVGSRTPWGEAQNVENIAPGIVFASTESHGGYKLTPERNKAIPAPLRSSSGWYEEDTEWRQAALFHPEAFAWGDATPESARADAEQAVKDYMPDAYEKVFGVTLNPGESVTRDRTTWAARHEHSYVTTSASIAESDPNYVRVTARRSFDGEEAEYLVPRDEYRSVQENNDPGRNRRFVIDEQRHPKLPPRPQPEPEQPKGVVVDDSYVSASALSQSYIDGVLTAASRDRVAKDLGKLYRSADGSVHSVSDIITSHEVMISAEADNGKMQYRIVQPLEDGSHYVYPVTKATFDYLDEFVPDQRSDVEKARQVASIARWKAESLMEQAEQFDVNSRRQGTWADPKHLAKARAAREEAARLTKVADELYQAQQAADIAANGTWEQRGVAAAEANAERERQAKVKQ